MQHRLSSAAVLSAISAFLGACAPDGTASVTAPLVEPPQAPGAVAVLTSTTWASPYRGGRGEDSVVAADASFTIECAPGSMAVGIHGRSGARIDRLGLVCQRLAPDGTLEGEDFRDAAGGEGGESFLSMCPAGRAIGGLVGQAEHQLDRIQIACDTLPGGDLIYGTAIGGPSGLPFWDVAPNRYFLTKIVVRGDGFVHGMWAVYNKVDP